METVVRGFLHRRDVIAVINRYVPSRAFGADHCLRRLCHNVSSIVTVPVVEPQMLFSFSANTKRPAVVITAQDIFTDEMNKLRQICFPGSSQTATSKDEFDDRSKHISILVQGMLAAYGRFTPGPGGIIETWSRGQAQVPRGKDVIDIGRFWVHPDFRGYKLFDITTLVGHYYAELMGFNHIVAGYAAGFHIGPRTYQLGFRDSGPVIDLYQSNGAINKVQPLTYTVKKGVFGEGYDWKRHIQEYVDKLDMNILK